MDHARAATSATSPSTPFPLAAADLCVKCGLCLPHCPTYLDSQSEADSPRGRIMLMQGLATGRIAISDSLEAHLDGCLGCRACEKACPAGVPYGALIDAGREQLAAQRSDRLKPTQRLSAVLSRASLRALVRVALWAYAASGLQMLVRRSGVLGRGRLARLESTLPRVALRSSPAVRATGAERGTVAIFIGCIGDIAEREVANDLARLLAASGFRAEITAAQTCCGAIDQHAGHAPQARRLAQQNVAAFGSGHAVAILPLATGCAATLLDYPRLVADGGQPFAARVQDPIAFLLAHGDALRFKPSPLRVAIHDPCTQSHVIGQGDALRRLLARIPGLEAVTLDATARCCGAAGTHFVTAPEAADRLLQPKLEAAARLAPQVIVSGNIGCSLHLAGGLLRAGRGVTPEVLHPVRLLARCLA